MLTFINPRVLNSALICLASVTVHVELKIVATVKVLELVLVADLQATQQFSFTQASRLAA
jgi:hypothetical protein